MRVLLAGATSAVGRPLVLALQSAGHEVIGLTHDPRAAERLIRGHAQAVVADPLDRRGLLAATQGLGTLDAVIHQVPGPQSPPTRHAHLNTTNALRTTGTRNLVSLARRHGARRFLTQSSVLGYGYTDLGNGLVTERIRFGQPRGHRGVRGVERHVDALAINEGIVFNTPGISGIALRYGLVYGADPVAIRTLLRDQRVPVPRSGGGVLPWVNVDDAVRATLAALERGRTRSAYNIVDHHSATWRDVVTSTASAYRAPAPRGVADLRLRLTAPYLAALALDTSMHVSNQLARDELDWAPTHDTYRDGVQTLTWA